MSGKLLSGEWIANRKRYAQRKGAQMEIVSFSEWLASRNHGVFQNGSARHVQTLTLRTQASCRCVRRGKYRSMKMRVLETELTSSPNVNITAYIQPRGVSRSNSTFQRLCGTLWSYKDGAPKPKESVALKPKSWFVRQKVLGVNIHETKGLLEPRCAPFSFWFFFRWP